MDQLVQTRTYALSASTVDDAWEMILGQLQSEMDKTSFETWVKPLQTGQLSGWRVHGGRAQYLRSRLGGSPPAQPGDPDAGRHAGGIRQIASDGGQ